MVINGDFEADNPFENWHYRVNAVRPVNDNGPSASGNTAMEIDPPGADIRSYTFPATEGLRYTASWDYIATGSNRPLVRLRFFDASGDFLGQTPWNFANSSGWTTIPFGLLNKIAPAATASADIVFNCHNTSAPDKLYIDNISVIAAEFLSDLNFDGSVDLMDFKIFADEWLSTGASIADINNDGEVNFEDFVSFLNEYKLTYSKSWDNGGADNKWSTSANWNPDGLPTDLDDVTIDLANSTCLLQSRGEAKKVLVGKNNTNCTLKIEDGELETNSEPIRVGIYSGSSGFVDIYGDSQATVRHLQIGEYGQGTLTLDDFAKVDSDFAIVVPRQNTGDGHIQLNNGRITGGTLQLGEYGGVGTVDFERGIISVIGDERTTLQGYIDSNYITTWGGQHHSSGSWLEVDYNQSYANNTTVRSTSLNTNLQPPTSQYVVDSGQVTFDEIVTISTLQGIIAKEDRCQIFIKTGASITWLNDLRDNYGIPCTWVNSVRGTKTRLQWLLDNYAGYYDGYILYDIDTNPISKLVAVALSGIVDAVAVNVDIESQVQSYGLTKKMDVTSRDDKWLFNNYGWDYFNHDAVYVEEPVHAAMLDWITALNILPIWNADKTWTQNKYNFLVDGSPCYGWGDPSVPDGEGHFIGYHSQSDLFQVPFARRNNVTTYASMANYSPKITFNQNMPETSSYTKQTGVHHVTFIWNSMDNCNFTTNGRGWAEDEDYYGSPHRGDFPVGWGMPGSLYKLAPTIVKWYYNNAVYGKDCFVSPFSGTGYVFPSEIPDLDTYTLQAGRYSNILDQHSIMIHDRADFNNYSSVAQKFARMVHMRGFFYTDYGDYNKWNGKIIRYWDKPFVSCRFELVRGTMGPEQLKNALNAQSTNSGSEDGYSYVCVRLGPFEQTMDDLKWIVDRLDSDVRVVSPEEFIEQIYLNNVW